MADNALKQAEKEADQVKQGIKAAGTAVAQFYSGNWGGAAMTAVKNFSSIITLLAVLIFLPLFIIAAIASSLFRTVSDDTFFSDPEEYKMSYEKLWEQSNVLVNDAYGSYYPKAVDKGEAVRSRYDKPSETITSEDGSLVKEYRYINNVALTVIPARDEMKLNKKNMLEMVARYYYLQDHILKIKDDPHFYDEYKDVIDDLTDTEKSLAYYKEIFVQSIKETTGTRSYFSASASPMVDTAEELVSEWIEEVITGYYEAGDAYVFPAGSSYSENGGIYTYRNTTYTVIVQGRTYTIGGTTYDGYAGGENKLPVTQSVTHQEYQITYSGSVRVNVSQNTDLFLKYDYRDKEGNLRRGLDTAIKEMGGNPATVYSSQIMTQTQKDIVDAAYATATAGDSMCAGWVSDVYGSAGFSIYGNANDMWASYTNEDYNEGTSQLKPGMLIAVDHASSDTSSDGYIYGHVSIYVGNGTVRTNYSTGTGGSVVDFTLEEWLAHYDHGTVRIGYPSEVAGIIERETPDVFTGSGYLQAALDIASDNSIGYCNILEQNLMNPNVDCGSFITFAMRAIGIPMGLYEPNSGMQARLEEVGFTYHEGMEDLQCGDILIKQEDHTEIYIGQMEGKSGLWQVGAHGYQFSFADQVSVIEYYGDDYWDGYYRANDLNIIGATGNLTSADPVTESVYRWIKDMASLLADQFIGSARAGYEGTGYEEGEVAHMYETLVGTITEEDINEAAQAIGFSRENAKRCERLVMREIPATDPYLQYLMACTAVNHGLENPDNLYASWGGADPSYTDDAMSNPAYDPDDHAILAVYLALKNLNTLAWDCHGFTLENALWCTDSDMAGYMGNVQDSNEAIYISHAFSWYYNYCVWPQDAMWYPQTQLSPNWDNN